ncbi:MAG: type II toxin-antitoxin system HicB family antitoxin [Oscillospiraceae bacterium]|nr:type II toxin-antitoxin system HicB family antitoxin [Oscillospiraceae bacterium]
MKYIYPAVFETTEDGGYDVIFPDIPRCYTCGKNLLEALEMAEDVLAMTLWGLESDKEPIPKPNFSSALTYADPAFVTLIKADTTDYKRKLDNRAVKKTLSIPAWLNHEAEAAHVNFSSILQEALKTHLQV